MSAEGSSRLQGIAQAEISVTQTPNNDVIQEQDIDLKRCLEDAEQSKKEGNVAYQAKKWEEALVAYRSGVGRLPKREQKVPVSPSKEKGKATQTDDSEEIKELNDEDKTLETKPIESLSVQLSELDTEILKLRSILNANIAACHLQLEEYKEAVVACTEALQDDPLYVKVLQRRAICNEKINSWSSLSSAQEDYNKLLSILPPSSPQVKDINRSIQLLKPRVEAAQKAETGEMLDKLKGLGNSLLGNFGLSTDNFQFVPNGQGGYSMNFVR